MKKYTLPALFLSIPLLTACGPKHYELGGIKQVSCDTRIGEDAYRHDPAISAHLRTNYAPLGSSNPADVYSISLDGFVDWKNISSEDGRCHFTLKRGTQSTLIQTDASLCSTLSTPQDPKGATHLQVSVTQHPEGDYLGYSNCPGSGVQQTYHVSAERIRRVEHKADTSCLPASYQQK